jgi:hypothetical protein
MMVLSTDRSLCWTMAQNEQRRATAADHGLKLRSAAVDAGRTRRDHTPCVQAKSATRRCCIKGRRCTRPTPNICSTEPATHFCSQLHPIKRCDDCRSRVCLFGSEGLASRTKAVSPRRAVRQAPSSPPLHLDQRHPNPQPNVQTQLPSPPGY